MHTYGKRPLHIVQDEIETFFNWYNVDGIFLDEVATHRSNLATYERLHHQVSFHYYTRVTKSNVCSD